MDSIARMVGYFTIMVLAIVLGASVISSVASIIATLLSTPVGVVAFGMIVIVLIKNFPVGK